MSETMEAIVPGIVDRLPEEFRTRAAALEAYAPAAATAFREAAASVERALTDAAGDALTLAEAAEASGYSTDHLSRLIARGMLRNVGRKHAPRVLRGELPRKPARRTPPPAAPASGLASDAPPPDVHDFHRARAARRLGHRG